MFLCFTALGPVVTMLQRSFDAFFDEKFSTAVAYAFRVIFAQVILAAVVFIWIFLPENRTCILGIGGFLGFV